MNTLVIENKGDVPIYVLAGTVVKGGKQDRQIGQDFIIEGKKTVKAANANEYKESAKAYGSKTMRKLAPPRPGAPPPPAIPISSDYVSK